MIASIYQIIIIFVILHSQREIVKWLVKFFASSSLKLVIELQY